MSIDISTLNPAELKALTDQAGARLTEISAEHRETTRAQLTEQAKVAGYDIYDLFGIPKASKPGRKTGGRTSGKTKLPAKYQSPDGVQSWVGKGKRPRWVTDYLSTGQSLDSLLISKVA